MIRRSGDLRPPIRSRRRCSASARTGMPTRSTTLSPTWSRAALIALRPARAAPDFHRAAVVHGRRLAHVWEATVPVARVPVGERVEAAVTKSGKAEVVPKGLAAAQAWVGTVRGGLAAEDLDRTAVVMGFPQEVPRA